MAPHSSTLAWKIPWTKEPGRLQSMGSLKSQTRLSNFTFMHWRRKWQPAPVFLPGKSQGRGSLVSCHLWGRTQSDTTEATQQQKQQACPTLCNSMDCSLPGSSVHGIFQVRILDGLPCPPPGDFPNPGIEPMSLASPALAGRFLTTNLVNVF